MRRRWRNEMEEYDDDNEDEVNVAAVLINVTLFNRVIIVNEEDDRMIMGKAKYVEEKWK